MAFDRLPRQSTALMWALSLVLVSYGCDTSHVSRPSMAGNASVTRMNFSRSRNVSLVIEDPRSVGIAEYGGYGAQVVLLARLRTGKIVIPCIQVARPRKGFMDRVYNEMRPQEPVIGMGGRESIALPISPEVDAIVFVIRALNEDTGWRCVEVKGDSAATTDSLVVPDLRKQEAVDQREDRALLLDAVGIASRLGHE